VSHQTFFPSPSSTQKHRGLTANHVWELSTCSLLPTPQYPAIRRPATKSSPEGALSAFLSVLSIFLSPYQLRESIAELWDTGSYYIGRKEWSRQHIKRNKDPGVPIGTYMLSSRHWRILGFGLRPRRAARPPEISTIPYRLMHSCFIPQSTWRKGFPHQNPS
jgi:hypothetical protein